MQYVTYLTVYPRLLVGQLLDLVLYCTAYTAVNINGATLTELTCDDEDTEEC